MAATVGSLMVADLTLLRQLGFAVALGILIDTFVIRPLLLPAVPLQPLPPSGRSYGQPMGISGAPRAR